MQNQYSQTPSKVYNRLELVGDYIGVESCLDLKDNEDIFTSSPSTSCEKESDHESFWSQRQLKSSQKWERKNKEFPPPIPSLARTENLSSHMPWVLKRYHTSDGRLILREEKVKHHEYFLAHRSNGRLTLQLVPLDSDLMPPPLFDEVEEAEEEVGVVVEGITETTCRQVTDNGSVENDDGVNDKEDCICSNDVTQEELLYGDQRVPSMESGLGGGGSFSFNSVRPTSTCRFGIPVPAMRPVHS